MPESTSFFIVAANGGMVAQKTPAGIYNKIADHTNTAQRWTLEYGDEAGTKVAIQNVSNGQWLRATSGAAAGKVDLGDKQWWTLEQGRAPGSCWIKCDDYPDAFLCNSYANYTDNNLVYMWPKQLNWTHSMLWYFQDAGAPGWTPKSYEAGLPSANASANSADAETLKQREADLNQKEQAVAARDEEQKQLEQKAAEEQKQLEQKAAEEQKQLEQKAAELKEKEQDIYGREAALKKEMEQLDAKKKDSTKTQPAPSSSLDDDNRLQRRIDDVSAREKQLAVKLASSTKKGLQLNAQEEELRMREKDLDAKMQAFNKRETPTKGGTEPAEAESLLIAENKNLKLQIQLQELGRRLTEAEKAAPSVNVTHVEQLEKENARLKDLLALQDQIEQSRPSPAQTERLKKEHERLKSLIAQQVQHRKLSSQRLPPKDADKGSESVDAGSSKPQAKGSIPNPATELSNKPLTRPAATANMGTRLSKARLPTVTGELTAEQSEQEKLREENARLKSEVQSPRRPTESNAPSSVGKVASNGHAGLAKAPPASRSGATKPKQHGDLQHPPSGAGHQRLPTTQANSASKARGPQKSTGKPNTSRPEKPNGRLPSSATSGNPRAPAQKVEDTGDIHRVDGDTDDGLHFSCGHVAYPAPRKIRRKMLGILYE
ncbi:hypothetical protein LTR78_006119 [Recurvomyces mirabilis]|uniref:Uncharacterized protein n=1 Tax=Recurvomyces mirabilis TaxID=574656 RepID=A0AAE0WLI4_9PEZI|nr:hypothetical protein LTR78_006119 [Recurvomyces mirabilis]KAK5151962.1 hypothetical protein LTS14_008736 [Recurvomyces mirabilis]